MIAPGVTATDPASVGSGYGEMLVGSLVVLGLVCLVAWLVVRFGVRRLWATPQGGVLAVVARVPLEPRRSLYVVEVGGKTLLVGTSEMGLSVLSELDGDTIRAQVATRAAGARSFGDAIRAVIGRKGGGGGVG